MKGQLCSVQDATTKVSVEVLQRVYTSLQDDDVVGSPEDGLAYKDGLNLGAHLWFIDSYEMPRWHWSSERGTFERASTTQSISGSPESRITAMRDRLDIIRQCILRNEHFAPSTIPSRDREKLVTLKSTKQLLGRPGHKFLLLGMLTHNKEGRMCLEDADGSVVLDYSTLDEPGEGLYTEGCFALIEGEYTEDATLKVIAIGQPPSEPRATARSIYGHIDFLGKGATSILQDAHLAVRVREELQDMHFFFLSDVHLDVPNTLRNLQRMFDNCIENDFIPQVIVLCGNFSSKSISQGSGRDIQRYEDGFDALADLIAQYPPITRTAHFVLVPGPQDLTLNSILPRRPIMSSFTSKLKNKIPKIHFASNPCRIKFFDQEIVIFREDMMSKILRNMVGAKLDVSSSDLKRYLVQTILDQMHLSPLALSIQPVLADYDHALRLYPLPTTLVLADKYDRYKLTYMGCHVFNPGTFSSNTPVFWMYKPAELNSEECVLDIPTDD